MKTLLVLYFGFCFIQMQFNAEENSYFYFGNTNLVGVGKIEDAKKIGPWKIFSRIAELDAPQITLGPAEATEIEEEFDLSTPLYIINFKDNLPDGMMEEFYPDGKIKKLVNFSEGKLNGDLFEFGTTGEILLSGRYFEDQKVGEWNSYYLNGVKKSENYYENDLLEGVTRNFYFNGVLAEVVPLKSGKLEGLYQSFFQSGAIQKRVLFKDGVEEGEFLLFFEDGQINVKCEFVKGELRGPWAHYDEDGKVLSAGSYFDGEKNGEWKEHFEKLEGFYRTGNYTSDGKTGVWRVIDSVGHVFQEEIFRQNQLVEISDFKTLKGISLKSGNLKNGRGRRIIYDAEGNRLEKGRYLRGKRQGLWYTYYPNTNLVASKGSYSAGEKLGTWKYLDFNSEIISEEHFSASGSLESKEASSIENHYKKRQDFGRNLVSEPQSVDDFRFLDRFNRAVIQR